LLRAGRNATITAFFGPGTDELIIFHQFYGLADVIGAVFVAVGYAGCLNWVGVEHVRDDLPIQAAHFTVVAGYLAVRTG
jgi:hypothetical protein